jgi:hypothetical protein
MRSMKLALALLCLCASLAPVPSASAEDPGPVIQLTATPLPTNFAPGSEAEILLVAANIGAAPTAGPLTLTDTLPAGVTPVDTRPFDDDATATPSCAPIAGQTISCQDAGALHPGRHFYVRVLVEVDPLAGEGQLPDQAQVEGGGALPVLADYTIAIGPSAPFGFLPGAAGLSVPVIEAAGSPSTAAGSHPYQLTANLGFPTERFAGFPYPVAAGHVRDAYTDLPRGMIVNPAATPVLCTEAELITETSPGCPVASAIGTITIASVEGTIKPATFALYNMVPPPGVPASFGFNAFGIGIFPHIVGSLRSDGDYGLSGGSNDILALTLHPVFGIRLALWGDPTDPAHDNVRGDTCLAEGQASSVSCPVARQDTALLTMPGQCTGEPSTFAARADSWEEPGVFEEREYESADLAGNPVSLDGCNQPAFEPTIEATPTTGVTDSPSGLDFTLHQPQDQELGHLSPAALKDATVALAAGLAANPAQADGLAVCTKAQIGLTSAVGASPVRFDKQPDNCPDAAKIGSLEITTPLLAQTDESGTKILHDPETGEVIPRALEGAVYLAEPFENPFDSLLAIYFSVNDPQSGTVAKLAGKVVPDPVTGQLRTRFEENPQLPLEDVTLHLFGGARATLTTPLSCGAHTTTSTLTPWTSPEGKDAHPADSFAMGGAPDGGPCPGGDSDAPNSPSFTAGTISPQAASYSPFALKLSRPDGSQRLSGIDTLLPPGLSGKLAGVGQCSEAQIARAISRGNPEEGVLEQASPSCPASAELGTVDVAAGSGPSPVHAGGRAYLAGPYKSAPLSMVVITPAVAGPFDLGVVVVRVALYVDPETAQIRAVSDPLPTILEGIPLDVRQISLAIGRPRFTLNPTSCDPMAITGIATSSIGKGASLTSPFQVGGCPQLPFKPKLSLRLKGGTKRASHPKLIANLKAKPGEANIAAVQVKLPPSAFLDQAHIRTICTRVQFAADACPKGSIYGKATAITPLLDDPLQGNVYLRSSNHKLPDLVVALKGPASMPIEIDLAGKTDSIKGALRNTFEAVPDAPVSKFTLQLFGGKRGLIVNSRDLCAHPYKAEANLTGQNGKVFDSTPVVRSDCKGGHRHRGRSGR